MLLYFTLLPYDYSCPSVQDVINERLCSVCGLYFASMKKISSHKQVHKNPQTNENDPSSPSETHFKNDNFIKNDKIVNNDNEADNVMNTFFALT